MLYAGSIARYGTLDLDGLVGIDSSLANDYFEKSYQAVKQIEGKFSLYRKNTNKEQNYADLFLAESSTENIFVKYFQRNVNAHGYDTYCVPFQYTSGGYSSYLCPPLEFVERFERKDGTPANLQIQLTYLRIWMHVFGELLSIRMQYLKMKNVIYKEG